MKSSKYTQATDFQDNLCPNIVVGTVLPPEPQEQNNQNARSYRQNGNSEELLLNSVYDLYTPDQQNPAGDPRYSTEQNSNQKANQEVELLCNCALKEVIFSPRDTRLPHFYNSEQNIVRANSNFSPTSNIIEYRNSSQYSLDRKSLQLHHQPHKYGHHKPKHTYSCQQNSRILARLHRNASLKRSGTIVGPEVTSVHNGKQTSAGVGISVSGQFDGYGPPQPHDGCQVIKAYDYNGDKDFKCDEFGFKRSRSIRSRNERSHRRAPDGTDSEMDEPELMFEMTEHLMPGDCRCACDHLAYSPAYTNCTQDERFPPAPDVTRRLGGVTPLGKPEGAAYYRTASATTNSSSSGSASSRIDLSSRHWWIIVTVLLLAAAAGVGVPLALRISAGASLEERLEFASRLLQEVPLIDGHNDLPWNIRMFLHNRLKDFKFGEDLRNVSPWSTSAWSHTDLPRLKQGHVAAQFWAAYVPCEAQYKDAVQLTLEQIDVIRRLTDQYHPSLTLCSSSEDIKIAYSKHQLCSLIGVEGGHSLAGSLAVLRTLYHVGVRYLTLTSTCNTPWADCSYADMPGNKPEHSGLTNFGKTVIKEMNRLGMIVDLSHVSVHTMRDALAVSKAPVIFSHSSAHALCNSTRNVPDETLQKLALNKGIIMVNFYSSFLSCKEVATVQDAVAHINHIRDVAGVDNVGIGAGYDGINYTPKGLEDVSSYPTLFAELIATGRWSTDDLKKLAGLNFLRVMQDVERIRDEFKKAKVPPYEDVLVPKPPSNCSSS